MLNSAIHLHFAYRRAHQSPPCRRITSSDTMYSWILWWLHNDNNYQSTWHHSRQTPSAALGLIQQSSSWALEWGKVPHVLQGPLSSSRAVGGILIQHHSRLWDHQEDISQRTVQAHGSLVIRRQKCTSKTKPEMNQINYFSYHLHLILTAAN